MRRFTDEELEVQYIKQITKVIRHLRKSKIKFNMHYAAESTRFIYKDGEIIVYKTPNYYRKTIWA